MATAFVAEVRADDDDFEEVDDDSDSESGDVDDAQAVEKVVLDGDGDGDQDSDDNGGAVATANEGSDGDVVILDLGDGDNDDSLADETGPDIKTDIRGWALSRGSVAMIASGQEQLGQDVGALEVPFYRYYGSQHLFLESKYRRGSKFAATVSGLIGFSYAAPTQAAEMNPVVEDEIRLEPLLREAYIGYYTPDYDLRIGQQRVPWGISDGFRPNDVLSARDNRDFLQSEEEVLQIPTPLVRVDLPWPTGALTLVYQPFHIPDKVDLHSSNWAAIQPDAPTAFKLMTGATVRSDENLWAILGPTLEAQDDPVFDPATGSGGAVLKWADSGIDFSHYYHYGFDRAPSATVDAEALAVLDAVDPDDSQAVLMALGQLGAGGAPVKQEFVRRHHIGSDARTTWGPFVLRADFAYDSKKVLLRRDLSTAISPSFHGVGAVEWSAGGDPNRTVLAEYSYQRFTDAPPDEEQLGTAAETKQVLARVRWKLAGKLNLEVRAIFGLRPRSRILYPELVYQNGPLQLRAGALLLDGDEGSTANYYRRNSTAYGAVRYAF